MPQPPTTSTRKNIKRAIYITCGILLALVAITVALWAFKACTRVPSVNELAGITDRIGRLDIYAVMKNGELASPTNVPENHDSYLIIFSAEQLDLAPGMDIIERCNRQRVLYIKNEILKRLLARKTAAPQDSSEDLEPAEYLEILDTRVRQMPSH